ncbi:MAG: DEAD/DEAH box helicase [Ignavibacteria bacterium]|nr:DEAD/DEAH box helicase [Ignavibacteria bacterium]
MIVLHLSLLDGVPHLWGERAEAPIPRFVRGGPRVHPLDAGTRGLELALGRIGVDLTISPKRVLRINAWLPSKANMPAPSTAALGVPFEGRGHPVLAPFAVTAYPLGLDDTLLLAPHADNDALLGTGVSFGPSIAWCGRLLKAALHIAASEHFLPGLSKRSGRWEARWVPFPDEQTERDLAVLQACMPAACRCLSVNGKTAPAVPPADIARRVVDGAVDTFVRWARGGVAAASAPDAGRQSAAESIHDAWLHALVSGNPVLSWPSDEDVRNLESQLLRWTRTMRLLAQSPFSLCFRLTEPAPNVPERLALWKVEYLLQPKADPSLLLPIAGIWDPDSRASRQLAKHGGGSLEFALTALGQAAGLCPPIADSLKRKHPVGFELHTTGAWRFLREEAPALQASGFSVLFPSWWSGGATARRLGVTVKASSPAMRGAGGMSLDALTSFDIAASLGGEEVSLGDLRMLARMKAPLVRVRGQWTHLEEEQIEAAVRMLEKHQREELTGRDLLALALGAEKSFGGLDVESVEVDGWIDDLVRSLKQREEITELPQPEGFRGTLRPYQVRGFSWLVFLRRWRLGACLADDMGLGKTVQALAMILHERTHGEKRPVLLLCPTSVMSNWRKEAENFTPGLPVLIHHGIDRKKKRAFLTSAKKHALVVSSYGLLHRDIDFLKDIEWAGAIFDEAQNVKNPDTLQAKAARALTADYRVALTGTPMENHVGDLWALMDLLNPGLLGSRHGFQQAFHRPIHTLGDAGQATKLRGLTGPFLLRRMKTDKTIISDLPDKLEMKDFCTLTKEQATLYQAVLDDMERDLILKDGMERRGLILATLTKLKQVCNHPAHFLKDHSALDKRSGKLVRLRDILIDIRALKERTLVFTQFAEMGTMLQTYFQDVFGEEVFFLHGGVPRKKRDEMVERFQNDARAPSLFVLSLKAGGTGLNLTRANHVVHFDRWWNPAVETQATDRAYRIGQEQNVVVRSLVVAGTLEERIDAMIESKRGIASSIVSGGEQWLTELSNEALFELFRLGAEAIGEDGDD